MKRGFVFPGQGSQVVGMGRALAEEFGEAVLFLPPSMTRLSKIVPTYVGRAGKRADAHRKRQPALMAVSMAVVGFWPKMA